MANVNIDQIVRDYMRIHAIKIWEWSEQIPDELVDKIYHCATINCSKDQVRSAIRKFQCDVRSRLQPKRTSDEVTENFLQFSVKLLCCPKTDVAIGTPKRLNIKIERQATAHDLKLLVQSEINISNEQSNYYDAKIIFKGHIIKSSDELQNYPLSVNSLVLVFLSRLEKDHNDNFHVVRSETSSIRDAAGILSARNTGTRSTEEFKLEIHDQNGKPVKMARSERKMLTVALTLVEQGKKMMKKNQFSDALFTFLEADEEFKHCQSSLLNLVDNYALLQMDIVWCYLRLENLDQLPDAVTRLQMCSEKLNQTMGPNLMRVELLKGKSHQEKALFVRLRLLEGVVFFYLKKYAESGDKLTEAQRLVQELAVDELKLGEMLMFGFDEKESRLSLRICGNQVPLAVEHALNEREKKETIRKQIEEEREAEILREKLGFTLAGNPVNVSQYKALRASNFPKFAVVLALKHFDNDINECLRVLEEKDYRELLHVDNSKVNVSCATVDELKLARLISLVDQELSILHCATALIICQNDVQQAHKYMAGNPQLRRAEEKVERIWSGMSPDEVTDTVEQIEAEERKRKLEDEAEKKLQDVITNESGDDYLDLDFKTEMPYIEQYLALLQTVQQL